MVIKENGQEIKYGRVFNLACALPEKVKSASAS